MGSCMNWKGTCRRCYFHAPFPLIINLEDAVGVTWMSHYNLFCTHSVLAKNVYSLYLERLTALYIGDLNINASSRLNIVRIMLQASIPNHKAWHSLTWPPSSCVCVCMCACVRVLCLYGLSVTTWVFPVHQDNPTSQRCACRLLASVNYIIEELVDMRERIGYRKVSEEPGWWDCSESQHRLNSWMVSFSFERIWGNKCIVNCCLTVLSDNSNLLYGWYLISHFELPNWKKSMHLSTLQTSIYSASIAIKYIKHLRGTIILHAPVKDFRNNNLAIFNALYK